ncbi:MAG: prolyl oligopeptidase family serine peptidase [Planctomycetes bacterium]|nr:prolyl oligopeptidase family serine peptidase [Planctomycetota bacterium]
MKVRVVPMQILSGMLLLCSIVGCGIFDGLWGPPGDSPTTQPAKTVRILEWKLQSHEIRVGELIREFLLYIPEAVASQGGETKVPLVFMIHGGGGTARNAAGNFSQGRWMELADRDRFAVVFPQGINNQWNDCRGDDVAATGATADDVGFFAAMIDALAGEFPIDTKRVYAAGISNGGMMSFRLAIELPERFAAVCSCVGSIAAQSECAAPTMPVPVMYMVGTMDPLMPYEGGPIAISRRNPQGRGTVLSAMKSLDFWRTANHATGMPTIENPPDTNKEDGSYVVITTWLAGEVTADAKSKAGKKTPSAARKSSSIGKANTAVQSMGGAEVVYYEMIGAGHGWPGGKQHGLLYRQITGLKNLDINGTDEAWKFFAA